MLPELSGPGGVSGFFQKLKNDPELSRLRAVFESVNLIRDDEAYAVCHPAVVVLGAIFASAELARRPAALGLAESLLRVARKIEDLLDELVELDPMRAQRSLDRIETSGQGASEIPKLREVLVRAMKHRRSIEALRGTLADIAAKLSGDARKSEPEAPAASPALMLPDEVFDRLLAVRSAQPVSVSRIGHYEILESLGPSRFLAVGPRGQAVLDTFRFDPDQTREDTVSAQLQRTAVALERASHPGVAALLEAGEADGTFFTAMARIDGVALSAVLAERTLDALETASVAAELFEALAHLHAVGVLVRDFRASAVVVRRDGHVVLADLGFARFVEEVTGAPTGLGSLLHLAPELLRGERSTTLSDQWALARVCLAAIAPMPPRGARGVLERLKESSEVSFSTYPADVASRTLRPVLETALAESPSQRFADASIAAAAFAEVARELRGLKP